MTVDSRDQTGKRAVPAHSSEASETAEMPFAVTSGATVMRIIQGNSELCQDILAEEVPVALVYNGISHAVMLSSPDHLDDLAVGFSLSEGIVSSLSEIYDIEVVPSCQGVEVRIEVSSRRFEGLKERRRSLAGRTGCGLCGVESLDAVSRVSGPVARRGAPIPTEAVARALTQMPEHQILHSMTGAVHGVAWVSPAGEVQVLREDVGRHNALDKLIGHLTRQSVDLASGFVLTSSRASYEMVQKSASVGIGMLVAVSAPTALAVRLATECRVTLAGFARGHRVVVYSHPEYLTSGEPPLAV